MNWPLILGGVLVAYVGFALVVTWTGIAYFAGRLHGEHAAIAQQKEADDRALVRAGVPSGVRQ